MAHLHARSKPHLMRTTIMYRLVALLLLLSPFASAHAQAVSQCEEALTSAEEHYVNAQFAETVTALEPCLTETGLATDQLLTAYRLLALAYIRMDESEDARAAVRELFQLDPEYQSDPVNDPPDFTVMVEIVRSEVRPMEQEVASTQRSWFRSHMGWIVTGGTLIAGGILAAVLSSGGGDSPDPGPALPSPPSLPN
jgi:hypothetical protein